MQKILFTLLVSMVLLGTIQASVLAVKKEYKLFVVALEKDYPDKPSSKWNPTLYCIDPLSLVKKICG